MNPLAKDAKIRAIFFDAVGTVLYIHPDASDVYAAVGREFGHFLPRETIGQRFRAAYRQQEREDSQLEWATSEEREIRRWQDIVTIVFQDGNEEMFRRLWEYFAQAQAWMVLPDTAQILLELSDRGMVLGLASNFDRRLHSVAGGFPELAPLQIRLISSEIGWRKPSGRFFQALVSAAGCLPEQILYVGDDRANDFDGADAAGLRAVLVEGESFNRIRTMRELLGMI